MKLCSQAQLQVWIIRFLALAAVAAGAWYIAQPVAQHFHFDLNNNVRFVVAAVAGIAAWFVSKRAFDFTEECLDIPQFASAAHSEGSRGSCSIFNRRCQAEREHADDAAPSSQGDGTLVSNSRLTIDVQATTITVTANGLTSSQFKGNNGLRGRLEAIRGIAWSNPTNLGESRRQMVGTLAPSANRAEVLARLQQVAQRFA
jgi:hypothetical protein